MKKIIAFLYCYLSFVFIFLILKIFFLHYYQEQSSTAGVINCLKVLFYGLPMDLSVAGYFTAIPALILWGFSCIESNYFRIALRIYFVFACLLISFIAIPDLVLYSYWGFRIDSTIFTYIVDPKNAAASVSGWLIAGGMIVILIWTLFEYFLLNKAVNIPLTSTSQNQEIEKSKKVKEIILFPILLVLMFVVIRGGISTSTMNVGRVYFSDNMYLNHAAINPCFSMLSSIRKPENFDQQYRFMDDQKAHEIVEQRIINLPENDSIPSLLTESKPNILIIILESFGKTVLEMKEVTPNLNRLAEESILFNQMYANSFRTDRGLAAILSGYPAQPTMSIIKYPKKTQNLPSIPSALKKSGYKTSFLYGGDVNFAYIKSYLVSQGILDITQDKDFPVTELMNKWGAQDHVTFNRLLNNIREEKAHPFLKIFLTLSSHEPFEVPMKKFNDPYLNSVAYTDSCLGMFIDSFKQTPEWKNTLLILVPDHDMMYPVGTQFHEPDRYDIFSVWAGGVIRKNQKIDLICSQTDIASTLLGQLKLDHSAFIFSRNLFKPIDQPFAFYDFPDGFGMINSFGQVVFDCSSQKILISKGNNTDSLLNLGKAYLQCLYNNIEIL